MTDAVWFVSMNGGQVEGQHEVAAVLTMMAQNPGAVVLVWRQGMAGWQAPNTLPEFASSSPAPTPASAPASRPSAGPVARAKPAVNLGEQMGFLRSLFNFSFDSFVTPRMISVLYAITTVAIAIGCLVMLFGGVMGVINGFRFSLGFGRILVSLLWLVLAPVLSLIYLAFARMFFEIVVVLFKIKDNTAR